jgi:5'-methylthioinosine phosphorylase
MLGIIGGTGLTELSNLKITKRQIVRTPYGEPSSPLVIGELGCQETIFLPRHGEGHRIPPHGVNYRANIWALKSLGVKEIIAIASVGGISSPFEPGSICVPNQIIDYTYGRKNTFYDGIRSEGEEQIEGEAVKHIDFTEPYAAHLRALCLKSAQDVGISLIDGGVYAAVQGPRLETAAEINRLEKDGASIVGMTGMPEAALAKELGIHYASLCPIANYAAGRGDNVHKIDYQAIGEVLNHTLSNIRKVLEKVVLNYGC